MSWRRKEAQAQTANTRLTLFQYSWLMRTYITPEQPKTFDSNIPDLYFKCGQSCSTECGNKIKFWEYNWICSPSFRMIGLSWKNVNRPNVGKCLNELFYLKQYLFWIIWNIQTCKVFWGVLCSEHDGSLACLASCWPCGGTESDVGHYSLHILFHL